MTHALLLRRPPAPSSLARTRLYAVSQCSLPVLLEALKYRDYLAARELWRQEMLAIGENGIKQGKSSSRIFVDWQRHPPLPELNITGA